MTELDVKIRKAVFAYLRVQHELDSDLRYSGERRPKAKGRKKQEPLSALQKLDKEIRKETCQRLYPDRIKMLQGEEERLQEEMTSLVVLHPAWINFLQYVKGIGPISAALLIGVSGDIENVNSVSGFWKSFGLDVENGRARKMVKGQQGLVGFPPARKVLGRVRVSIFKIGARHGGFYYKLYEKSRAEYDSTHPDWQEGRRLGAGIRKMEKILLAHIWEVWRKSLGLPAPEPYILQVPPHGRKITPEMAMEMKGKSSRVARASRIAGVTVKHGRAVGRG